MIIENHTLAASTSYATPYYVIRGELPGPTFMVVSGIHGNETGSIGAAQRIVDHFMQGRLYIYRGTILVIPLMNQKAYRKRIRGIPDLNRTFPRSSSKRSKHPLAAALLQLALRYRPTWYLDLRGERFVAKKSEEIRPNDHRESRKPRDFYSQTYHKRYQSNNLAFLSPFQPPHT